MSPIPRVVPQLAVLAALLVIPSAVMAQEESPYGLGPPQMTDNPNLDHNFYGGDAGSPWPVSIRTGRGHGPSTQSTPPAPAPAANGQAAAWPSSMAVVPWPGPALALLPGSLPQVLWLPLTGACAGIGEGPLTGGREEPLPD